MKKVIGARNMRLIKSSKEWYMKIFRHLINLLKEIFSFAWNNKAWWIIPIVLVLLLLAVVIIGGEAAAPFIYTLF